MEQNDEVQAKTEEVVETKKPSVKKIEKVEPIEPVQVEPPKHPFWRG